MLKNIIFDMGGVLVDLCPERSIEAFVRLGAESVADYIVTCRTEDLFLDIELGIITTAEFCSVVREMAGKDIPDEAICAAWNLLLESYGDARGRSLRALKEAGYTLYLLSNTCEMHWHHASKELIPADGDSVDDYFERCFLSYELHLRKPAEAIYTTVLRLAGLDPAETIFIDDNEQNVLAASMVGMHTFHERDDHRWTECLTAEIARINACCAPCCATVGFFDGVHRGHQYLLDRLVREAKQYGLRSTVITFRDHPRAVLHADYVPQLLTTNTRKESLLRSMGVDEVVLLPFDKAMSTWSAKEFMTYIYNVYGVRRLFVGYDHRFGHGRTEGIDDYVRYGERLGMAVTQGEAYVCDGVQVSSSVVRRLLTEGDIDSANAYLGYCYRFSGVVVRGRGEGRRLGYPTANMLVDARVLLPRRGVYAVRVTIASVPGTFVGMMNIGVRPTYGGEETMAEVAEVHILHFDKDIYDSDLTVEVVRRLRDERRFTTVDELVEQLHRDKEDILARECDEE